jgi:hypothetical protein
VWSQLTSQSTRTWKSCHLFCSKKAANFTNPLFEALGMQRENNNGVSMKGISIKGVVIGSVTDIVATNLITIPIVVYVMTTRDFSSVPQEQISTALFQVMQNDTIIFSVQLILASICSVLGGYIAARIAKRNELLNGTLASILCVGSGVYGLFFGTLPVPLWQHLAGFVLSPSLAAFGGYLRIKTKPSQPNA